MTLLRDASGRHGLRQSARRRSGNHGREAHKWNRFKLLLLSSRHISSPSLLPVRPLRSLLNTINASGSTVFRTSESSPHSSRYSVSISTKSNSLGRRKNYSYCTTCRMGQSSFVKKVQGSTYLLSQRAKPLRCTHALLSSVLNHKRLRPQLQTWLAILADDV